MQPVPTGTVMHHARAPPRFLGEVAHSCSRAPEDRAAWDLTTATVVPSQSNHIDCGVFLCAFVEATVDGGGRVRLAVGACCTLPLASWIWFVDNLNRHMVTLLLRN